MIISKCTAYQEITLSAKDEECFKALFLVNVVVLNRLTIAFRFARDETDVITDHPHIEQDYTNMRERWEKFDVTCNHQDLLVWDTYLHQLLLLYHIQAKFLQVLVPLLASSDIGDEQGPMPVMLHQPYK